jgi:hypothetical protein
VTNRPKNITRNAARLPPSSADQIPLSSDGSAAPPLDSSSVQTNYQEVIRIGSWRSQKRPVKTEISLIDLTGTDYRKESEQKSANQGLQIAPEGNLAEPLWLVVFWVDSKQAALGSTLFGVDTPSHLPMFRIYAIYIQLIFLSARGLKAALSPANARTAYPPLRCVLLPLAIVTWGTELIERMEWIRRTVNSAFSCQPELDTSKVGDDPLHDAPISPIDCSIVFYHESL